MTYSPRYSVKLNRNFRVSGCDARLDAALDAIRSVAAADPDRASVANRIGFSRSDASRGHRLAEMSLMQVGRDRTLSDELFALAIRYRRQIPNSIRMALGLSDQYDFFD